MVIGGVKVPSVRVSLRYRIRVCADRARVTPDRSNMEVS